MTELRSPANDVGTSAGAPNIDPADNDLAQEIFKKLYTAKEYRKVYDKDWHRFYQYWAGFQWPLTRPDWMSTPVTNYIFSTVSTAAAIMSMSKPNIDVTPVHPKDAERASILHQVLKQTWRKCRMKVELYKIITDSLIYGTAFAKVIFNKQKGRLEVLPIPPYFVYPAPGAINIEDSEYVCFAQPMPVAQIEAMYPESRGKIKSGVWDENIDFVKNITSVKGDLKQAAIIIEGQEPGISFRTPNSGQMDKKGTCTYVEYWYRNPKNWNETMVAVAANGLILAKKSNPYKHNKFPFVRLVDYPVSSVFWGIGEVHQLEKLQDSINQRDGQVQDILRLTASPAMIYSKDAGLNPHAFPFIPGIKIPINPGSTIQWVPTPQINPALYEQQATDKVKIDVVSGIGEVTQGRREKGVTTAAGMQLLADMSRTRVDPKINFLEEFLSEVGLLMVETIRQFYTEEQYVRIAGGPSAEFVKVNEETMKVDENGEPIVKNDLTEGVPGEYEVEIGVGSDLGVDKAVIWEALKEAKAVMPDVVDNRTLLENLPGISQEKVEQMLKRYDELKAEAEQAPAGPGPGVPPESAPQGPEGAPGAAPGQELPPSPDDVQGMGLPDEAELQRLEQEFGINK